MYVYYSDTAVKWSPELKAITVKPFTETDGLKIPIPSSAIEMFFLFFTSSLMNYIVNLTNQFALELRSLLTNCIKDHQRLLLQLHQFLDFADNSTLAPPDTPEYNKLGKVQPIIDSITKSF